MEEMKDLKQGSRRGNQFRGRRTQPNTLVELCNSGQLPLHERLYLQRGYHPHSALLPLPLPLAPPLLLVIPQTPSLPRCSFPRSKTHVQKNTRHHQKPRVESSDSQAALLPVPQGTVQGLYLEELVVQKIDLLSGKEGLEKHAASLNGHQQRMSPQAMVAARRPDHGGTVGSTVSLLQTISLSSSTQSRKFSTMMWTFPHGRRRRQLDRSRGSWC
ncbi:hypothetical protein HPP92_006282 [Vanilla planifolia]|uniref:Uncharacterized protein n=1 Tax=Vanilla planifolia TaxID=51239 RepID=A0A835S0F2_VANPL|nr:hypothetical protein HPP92_006556 [Vanilla planifolia]KAG0495288.1 hypothetical protein HPP92_006282 [Vanilla planifolia]